MMRLLKSYFLLLIPVLLLTGNWSQAQGQTFNPGDPIAISGKVISIDGDKITLEVGDPSTGTTQQEFNLTPAYTVVDASGNNLGSAALVPGLMVKIEGVIGDDFIPIFSKVAIDANQPGDPPPDDNPPAGEGFGGIVRSNNGTTLQLEGYDDVSQTTFSFNVTLAAGGKVFDQNHNEITLSQIPVGNIAHGLGEKQSNGDFVAFEINDGGLADTGGGGDGGWQPGDTFEFGGEVDFLGSGFMILKSDDQTTGEVHHDTVYFDSGIVQDPDGNSASLNIGDMIGGTVVVQTDGSLLFTSLTVFPPGPQPGEVHPTGGQVIEVGADFLVVTWSDSSSGKSGTDTLYVPTGLVIVDENGNPATPQVGDHVGGDAEIQADGSFLLISLTVYSGDVGGDGAPGDTVKFGGRILSFGSDFIEVEITDPDGVVFTERGIIDANTTITDSSGNPAVLSNDLLVEGTVIIQEDTTLLVLSLVVRGDAPPPGGEPVPFSGLVIGVGADYLDVEFTDEAGSVDSIRIKIDSLTVFTDENGIALRLADFVVGDMVHGEVIALGVDDLIGKFIVKGAERGDNIAGGVVQEVGPDYVVILAVDTVTGTTETIRVLVDNQTTILDEDSTTITLADIAAGDHVAALISITSNNELLAVTLRRLKSGPTAEVSFLGNIIRIFGNQVLVSGDTPTGIKFYLRVIVSSGTELLDEAGDPIDLTSLSIGDRVHGEGDISGDFGVNAVKMAMGEGDNFQLGQKVPHSGIITEVGADYFVSEYGHPALTKRNKINSQTVIRDVSDNDTSLNVGDFFKAVSVIDSDGSVTILQMHLYDGTLTPPGVQIQLDGSVTEVGRDYLIVQDQIQGELKILFLANTLDDAGNLVNAGNYQTGDTFTAVGMIQACELVVLIETAGAAEQSIAISGTITEVGADYLVLAFVDSNGVSSSARIEVDQDTRITDLLGTELSLEGLFSGDFVIMTGTVDNSGRIIGDIIQKDSSPVQPDTLEFRGEVIALGEGYFEISLPDSSGEQIVVRGYVGDQTPVTDKENNPVELKVGDEISGRGLWIDAGAFDVLFVVLETEIFPVPLPGEAVEVDGRITEISGTRINLEFDDPDSPVPSSWIDIPAGTAITASSGLALEFGWLAVGDLVYVEGTVNQDSISVTANKIEYLEGTLRLLSGRVVSVGATEFEMEARDGSGRAVVAQIAIGSGTSIVRQETGEVLTISGIIKGTSVTAVARLISGTSFNAILVTVPPLERFHTEGRVLELISGGFSLEIQENQNTYKAAVTTSGATVWLLESNGGYQAATAGDLAADDLVRVSGVRTGALSANADTVIIRDTGELQVRAFTIRDGKLANSSFTFRIDLNEGTGSVALDAPVSLTVTPDFANLSGTIDLSAAGSGINALKLIKVSGTSGALTGRWSGYSQADDDDKVLVSAEFFQSGSTVTGTVTRGGQAGPGDDTVPEAGDEVSFIGQVTAVEAPVIVVSYLNQLNQRVDKPVIIHDGTQIVDVDGKALRIELDSLLSREVDVSGIIQENLSVVASKIEVYPVSGEDDVSVNLPQLSGISWNSSTLALSFSLGGELLDNITSQSVAFSGQLSADGNSLGLQAVIGSDTLTFSVRRFGGDDDDISGEWTGSVTQQVSGRTKIWPAFLSIFERDGSYSGNYEIGESRFKTVVATRNNAPVFQPIPEVETQELQNVTIQLSASDLDGDPISLSVSGVSISGATFTDNGDGTGTYSLTVPQLPAGKNELFVNFSADDGKGAVSSIVVEIEVAKLNRLPEIGSFQDTLRLIAGQKFQVTIPVRDDEGGVLEFEYSDLPTWARTSASQVTFEPPFGSAGAYSFTVKVEDDDEGEASKTFYFKVIASNRDPRFTLIDPVEAQAGETVSFTVLATDPDAGDVLTYSAAQIGAVSSLPTGATFDPASGAFNWTPALDQIGPFKAEFVVTDSKGARALMTVNISVGQGGAPPTLIVPDSLSVLQGQSASFTASGQNSSGDEVEFLARNLPPGADWSTAGDSLEWFPSFTQQGVFVVTMSASDGSFRTDRDVVIVVNPIPQIPTLEQLQDYTIQENQVLHFQVNGSYPDGGRVVFDPPVALPLGSGFDVLTGSFRFLPDYTQAGSYPLSFSVTAPDGNVYSVGNTVTVTNKNRGPRIADLDNFSVVAGEAVTFTVNATDPDPNETLTIAAANLPSGASFDTGVNPPAFSWTPTAEGTYEVSFTAADPGQLSDRATVVITVGEQNLPPVLGQLADLRVSEGDTLTLVVSASDPEGEQVSVFVSPMPSNASFDNEGNTFTFQPSYAQAGSYNLSFVASDGELTDESRITVTVVDFALPPRITVPTAWTLEEGDELQFTVNVRDVSGNRRPVHSSNLPPGAALESETGKFLWRPLFDQAGEYQVTFNASDGNLSAQADVRIMVLDKNQPPVLFRVDNKKVLEGELIGFEISVFDPDGDEVTIGIDSSGTPYINSAEIRNNNVFVFNTALLDSTEQIPSAVFKVTADDGRGGADTMRVDFKIIRRDDINVPDLPPGGDPFSHVFPGTGLSFRMSNNGSDPIGGQITGSEISGALDSAITGATLLAGMEKTDLSARYPQLAGSKDKVEVLPFLSDGGTIAGDFYSVRRGWGLDLSSDLLGSLTSLQFDLTLSYQDRDIPATDIPEFLESAISIFGLDASGNFVQITTRLDIVANTATAPVDLSIYTDFTLGVILDLAEPVISYTSKLVSTTNEVGPYGVITTIVDNVLIRNARLYYSSDGETYNSVAMKPDTVLINGFTGDIPGHAEGKTVYYYIEASDEEHTVTDPAGAPQSAYQFSILLDGVAGASGGDSNGDGKVDVFDLLDVLSILGGKKGATTGADADGNGRVDIFDLLKILGLLGGN
ncbi:putative Ig domain-containing protein [Gemmatimonadota bacterium]